MFKPGSEWEASGGNRSQTFKAGHKYRWQPGVSGNPVGTSKRRAEFEQAFTEALLTTGSPTEAAELLWKAARAGEAWAIQNLCQRFAPMEQSLRLVHEVEDGGFDYSRLSDEQIQQLEAILESVQPVAIESGEGGQVAESVHPAGMADC